MNGIADKKPKKHPLREMDLETLWTVTLRRTLSKST